MLKGCPYENGCCAAEPVLRLPTLSALIRRWYSSLQAVCEALETCELTPNPNIAVKCTISAHSEFLVPGPPAKVPEEFLRGCGVPEDFITYLPSLIGTMQPIQYQSCFISDRSQDDEFARRLHEKMRGEKLRVWFAPEHMQGGKKLIEQIDRAIQVNDRLLLVLSEHSMNSEWVKTEIRRARRAELREQRQKLFPIRLVSIDRIRDWSCFDADTGKDLAVELREYHIPDFSNWKNQDAFESAFADLLRDLRAQA